MISKKMQKQIEDLERRIELLEAIVRKRLLNFQGTKFEEKAEIKIALPKAKRTILGLTTHQTTILHDYMKALRIFNPDVAIRSMIDDYGQVFRIPSIQALREEKEKGQQ